MEAVRTTKEMGEARGRHATADGRAGARMRASRRAAPHVSRVRSSSERRRSTRARAAWEARSRAQAPPSGGPAADRRCPHGPAGRRAHRPARGARRRGARPRQLSVAHHGCLCEFFRSRPALHVRIHTVCHHSTRQVRAHRGWPPPGRVRMCSSSYFSFIGLVGRGRGGGPRARSQRAGGHPPPGAPASWSLRRSLRWSLHRSFRRHPPSVRRPSTPDARH